MDSIQAKLRQLPAVDRLLAEISTDINIHSLPHGLVVTALRQVIGETRHLLLQGHDADISTRSIVIKAKNQLLKQTRLSLRKVVNGTGVVMHTNLGRAPLGERAAAAIKDIVEGYCTLEYDLATGGRGTRYAHVVDRICDLTGAEDALVVNNNAAAVLLTLSSLAKGREVIVSRGQLVEIGGSFRIPEVMEQSGATLVEVGATNKTHLQDFSKAINDNTAAILKVHTSNYRIIGFTAQPDPAELVVLAQQHAIPVIDDLGSGTLIEMIAGGWQEPTVKASLAAGIDVVTFSGDKLLGAGQAGIIAGKKQYINVMKKHPLLRAIRIDKLSLAALEGTLLEYQLGTALTNVPVQRMLHASADSLKQQADQLEELLSELKDDGWQLAVVAIQSQAGGGSLPAVGLDSYGVSLNIAGKSAASIERFLRQWHVPIIVRIQDERIVIDVRCLTCADMEIIQQACLALAKGE